MKYKGLMEEAVRLFDGGYGYRAVAAAAGVPRSTARKWQYAYRARGKEALLSGRNNAYSWEQKLEARVRELELELEIQKRINTLADGIERRSQRR